MTAKRRIPARSRALRAAPAVLWLALLVPAPLFAQPTAPAAQSPAPPAGQPPAISAAPQLSERDRALREAAAKADAAGVKALLKQGASANSVDGDGVTPLMIAVVGDVERVRSLAEKGLGDAWQKGLKKVIKALRGDAATAAALLDGGAQVNAQGRRGVSALALAALGGKPELVKLLLERGADPDARGERGETALMVASVAGHGPTVTLLLERGADPLAATEDGITAPLAALLGGHPEIIELLAKGAKKPGATF